MLRATRGGALTSRRITVPTGIHRLLGLAILLGVAVAIYLAARPTPPMTTITGYVGGEKELFLADPQVQRVLVDRYRMALKVDKRGSLEMDCDRDIQWPSSPAAPELYTARCGAAARQEDIFDSPVVLYSWDIVAEALERQGLARRLNDSCYSVDLAKLTELMMQEKRWEELGLPQLYGKAKVVSPHPAKTNSGSLFAVLLATTLNGGETLDEQSLSAQMPQLDAYFQRLGRMEDSGTRLFDLYLKQGVGAYPIIVGYENQIIRYAIEHRDQLPLIQSKVRLLYPMPTIWATHVLIARTENARGLVDALKGSQLQELAWKAHGFRTGTEDPNTWPIIAVKAGPEMVMPMPRAAVVQAIVEQFADW